MNLAEETITISGEKKKKEKVEKKGYYRLERSYGSFARSFNLPSGVRTDDAHAPLLYCPLPADNEAVRMELATSCFARGI